MSKLALSGTPIKLGTVTPSVGSRRLRNWLNAAVGGSPNVWLGMDSLAEWKAFAGANGYAEKLRATLQSTFGNRGNGWFGVHRNQSIPNANEWTIGANWVKGLLSPNPGTPQDTGPFPDDVVTHAGTTSVLAADLITVAEPQPPFDSYEIFYNDNAGAAGTWAYRADGGAWVNGPAQVGDNALKKLTVAGTFATSLDIRPSNAAGSTPTKTSICGVRFLNSGTGARVDNVCHSGETMQTLIREGIGRSLSSWLPLFDTPDLIVVDSGNDAVSGNDPVTFGQNFLRYLTRLPSTCAIILVTPPPFDPVANPTRPYVVQSAFRDQYYKVAAAVGAEVIDIYNAWGESYTTAQGLGFTSIGDGLHPLDLGHQDIHDRVARRLGLL